MASQLACVATNVGGNTGALHDGSCGRLFSPGDVVGLASILSELAADADRRHDLARGARMRAEEKYSIQRMLRDYRLLYEGALNGARNGRARQLAASKGL